MLRKWSTKAEERTFLHGSQDPSQTANSNFGLATGSCFRAGSVPIFYFFAVGGVRPLSRKYIAASA